jgi:hypothetical protein
VLALLAGGGISSGFSRRERGALGALNAEEAAICEDGVVVVQVAHASNTDGIALLHGLVEGGVGEVRRAGGEGGVPEMRGAKLKLECGSELEVWGRRSTKSGGLALSVRAIKAERKCERRGVVTERRCINIGVVVGVHTCHSKLGLADEGVTNADALGFAKSS